MFYFMWTRDENLLLRADIVTTFEVEAAEKTNTRHVSIQLLNGPTAAN